jgi:pimeloyl-ACP methyl ester carboxylesterase
MPYFNPVPTLQLFYTLHGPESAPPLLLIHGWCCNSHDWDFSIAPFAQTYRVIAFDLRGHGHSTAPESLTYRLKDHMSDAVALLHHLGYDRDVRIVGHSMGGMLTSALSVTQPELFKALVVVDPHYFALEAMSEQVVGAYDAAGGDAVAVNLQFWPTLYGEDTPQWRQTWYLRRVEETPPYVMRGCVEGSLQEHVGMSMEEHWERRRKSMIPRLAIHTNDEDVEREKELGVKEVDEVVKIGGVGHWMHHAKPDEFNKVLLDWLKKMEDA